MKIAILFMSLLGLSTCAPVFIISSDEIQQNPTPYAHEAVLKNSAMESLLPSELRNHFYDNPHTAAGLAQQSWLGYKEMQVINREADKIPREKIFHALQNAGFAR
ncbi:hypothetical protein HCN44_008230 [Aphidius gifuensis]|uniref:Gustatory receptor n=1 Tax=Aphidius gifuensis TaxID=684658 RepID=A0A834XNZ6_APHGI|nr:uncharacterized protein LOC122857928 [Aphidius gifuensis]XP_044016412.1 uncharacterized protein LOC122857928 [Aphidius gifuensis]KAF7989556.1 hypothetical protein HCN44_008230 [Aphidius gifuensis]